MKVEQFLRMNHDLLYSVLFIFLVFIVLPFISVWEIKFWHNYDKFTIVDILKLWDMWLLKYYGWCVDFYYKFCINGNNHVHKHKLQLNQW
jgi:hypothetical protein